MNHPLDRPVWNTLTSRWAALSLGDRRACRLDPKIGPFAAAADGSPPALAALGALAQGELWLVEADEPPVPPGTALVRRAPLYQMVAEALTPADPPQIDIVPLDESDASAMFALATLTQPGPWASHTHRLGGFVGVKSGSRLVAMAGERMKLDGFTEVSGVCTHPDHRGNGYAAALMRAVASRILARGDQAFLHVYPSNAGAIALYEALGFRVRREMALAVVEG